MSYKTIMGTNAQRNTAIVIGDAVVAIDAKSEVEILVYTKTKTTITKVPRPVTMKSRRVSPAKKGAGHDPR